MIIGHGLFFLVWIRTIFVCFLYKPLNGLKVTWSVMAPRYVLLSFCNGVRNSSAKPPLRAPLPKWDVHIPWGLIKLGITKTYLHIEKCNGKHHHNCFHQLWFRKSKFELNLEVTFWCFISVIVFSCWLMNHLINLNLQQKITKSWTNSLKMTIFFQPSPFWVKKNNFLSL